MVLQTDLAVVLEIAQAYQGEARGMSVVVGQGVVLGVSVKRFLVEAGDQGHIDGVPLPQQ